MRVAVSSTIARPADKLFWLSQDYTRRLEWDKYLSEAYLIDGHKKAAVGVGSFCKNRSGAVLISEYISFAPPTHAAVRMTSGPWILSKFGGTWRFEDVGGGRTKVRFIYNFKVRPRLLSWLLEPIVGYLYRRDMQRRLDAFGRWAEQQ